MANPKCLGEGVEWARYILPHLAYQNVNNAPFTIKMSRQKNLQKQFDLCFCYFFHIMGYHKTMLMANPKCLGEGVEWARYILPHLAYQNVKNALFTIKISRQRNLQKQFDLCFCHFFDIMGYHSNSMLRLNNYSRTSHSYPQNTLPLICISLNKSSNYCYIPRS